jgi:rubredoxin
MNPLADLDSTVGTQSIANRKWICLVCDYIYDEAKGIPEEGIAPGTAMEDIPDTWACPDCGVTKADFEPYTE